MNPIQRIKGTQDILPGESRIWTRLEQVIREIMDLYNFQEIRTPVFEKTELFARGIGQLTDIVSKEMYTFLDRGKKQLTLKPEMTAPVMRAFIENKLYAQSQVTKLFYISPLFRQENPQAGRLRQFHQFGAETLGTQNADADVEQISLALSIYKKMGIKKLQLSINSVGDADDRVAYKKVLQEYIKPNLNLYCPDCQRRYEENPMRILDCKNQSCIDLNKDAPKLIDYLGEESRAHYEELKYQLKRLNIEYREDPALVRGLDYYTRTVFEISSDALGSQNAVCGGGRYDLLAEELGGISTPAVGFASGIERLLMIATQQDLTIAEPTRLDIFVACMGSTAQKEASQWLEKLRSEGFSADTDFLGRSIKAQMREANKKNARFVLILGDDELSKQVFAVKLMDKGEQIEIPFDEVITKLELEKKEARR